MLRYDIGETGEMHHNPAKNVLYVRASVEEIAERVGKSTEEVQALLDSAKKKMYAERLKRPTPFVDKTVYVNWNALCVSAYLKAARVLKLEEARHFALRSLDRILSQAWNEKSGLQHVIAYSAPLANRRHVPGVLDDYAFTAIACLDAYEATADLSYFHFAEKVAEAMIARFHDPQEGGFFDMASGPEVGDGFVLGALAARRKPLQDLPTPAGNPAAAMTLLRLHAFTNNARYRSVAEGTLKAFAEIAHHYGLFAASYGIALDMYLNLHTQVVITGHDAKADQLEEAALRSLSLNKAVLHFRQETVVPQMLPPALAETIPNLPGVKESKTMAVVCREFSCQPPMEDVAALEKALRKTS
jgi:uncharacterized protein YyaL (SSP411 family)